ncbi:copper chaperone PCu(A)C [Nonomuraea sp. SBT364]|uniref:copper chaperone PCu(A)C n=1 Tax=Nonomuraea sp. SBT364 TaxID=1580530 RepID=UPI00066D18D8|nr:copper chaperone PCu(A)C [Nonomuraea sp. SBT364]
MYVRPALLLAAVVALSGCGSSPETTAATGAKPTAEASAAVVPAAQGLTISDPWVKTVKKGMTAAFGTLVNDTGADLTVTAGASPLSPVIELHEVVDSGGKMVMRPKEGGFVVPAGGKHELRPGGDHIMLMGVSEEVKPGARISFTLTVKGGAPLEFTAIGKDFAGGEEDYQPGMEH